MPDGSLIFDTRIDPSGFEQSASNLKGLATKVTTAIGLTLSAGAIAKGLVSLGKTAVSQGSAFEVSMSQVAATMGTTVDQIQDLSAVAKEMGSSTKFSATEAADALNYLALAGMGAEEQIGALPTVLNLAAAGNMDLAYASDLVTDSMSALGLSIDEMEGFADQMARTASSSNTSVSQLGEAILVCGGQAKLAGLNTVELNTALGILADNGIKGSEGGTALRNTLKNLYTPTKQAKAALEELGVKTADESTGKLRSVQEVLQDLTAALDGLGDDEQKRMGYMAQIFDTRTISAANALLKSSGDRFTELSQTITNSFGAAAAMARTQLDNLKGDITLAQSAMEGLSVTAYGAFSGSLRGAVQGFTNTISGLTDALGKGGLQGAITFITDEYPVATAVVSGLAAAYGGLAIIKTIQTLTAKYAAEQAILDAWLTAGTAAEVAEAGVLTVKQALLGAVTGKLTLAQAAQAIFNKTVLANPYVAAAAALGAVVAGLVLLTKHTMEANPQIKELRDNTQALEKANKDLAEAQASSAESFAKTTSEIESQAIFAENAYNKLAELSDAYTGTEAEQRLMSQLCSELNSAVTGLNISYDQQTGALNVTADAMDRYISKMKEQAQAAANQERYTQLMKEQADAQYNLFLAEKNLTAAREQSGFAASIALGKAESAYHDAQVAANDASAAVDQFDEYMRTTSTTTEEAADAVDEYSDALEGAAEAEEAIIIAGVNVRELLDSIGMSAEDAEKRFASYADAATDMFNRINTKSELSTKQMTENLDFNANAIEEYGKNLARLAEVLPEDLYTALAGDPAQMAGVVAELASSSDAELGALADSFANAGDAAREAWLASMGAVTPDDANPVKSTAEAVAADTSLSEALTQKANDAYTDFELAVGTAGFAQIGSQISDDVVQGTSGLSGRMYGIGQQAMNGLIAGLNSRRADVVATVASIVNQASATVTLNLQIASPSKLWRKYGEFTVDGFILGIKDKIGAVQAVMKDFTSASGDAAYPVNVTAVQENRAAAQTAPVSNYTNVTQNIYAEKQSPAEMLREAKWQQQKAVLMGV